MWHRVKAALVVTLWPFGARGQTALPTPADSAERATVVARAAAARGLRLVVSLDERRLWALAADDTLLATPVAVASGQELEYQGRRWRFVIPRGTWPVVAKDSLPVWVPPEWHYYEVAKSLGLTVRAMPAHRPAPIGGGRRLEVRGDSVVVVGPGARVETPPRDEELVFGATLFIPPVGTRNRRIEGELGRYRLALPGGYSLHGTPWHDSIGAAVTHGCVRLDDADVAWLYVHVPVGTPVYVY